MNSTELLLKHDIKPSIQRIIIMDYLRSHPVHPTVDDIYNALSPQIPTLSKTTVYNTLKLFVENGVAISINIEEKNVRYDGDVSTHAHFICTKCGSIHDIFPESLESLNIIACEHIGDKKVIETQVYYKGYCENCNE